MNTSQTAALKPDANNTPTTKLAPCWKDYGFSGNQMFEDWQLFFLLSVCVSDQRTIISIIAKNAIAHTLQLRFPTLHQNTHTHIKRGHSRAQTPHRACALGACHYYPFIFLQTQTSHSSNVPLKGSSPQRQNQEIIRTGRMEARGKRKGQTVENRIGRPYVFFPPSSAGFDQENTLDCLSCCQTHTHTQVCA